MTIVAAVVAFIVGVIVGDLNKSTVDNAIAALRRAERSAETTLAKITSHKAS